jgi:hypothetical protein
VLLAGVGCVLYRLCIISEEFSIYISIATNYVYRVWYFFGDIDRGRSMCVTRRCRLCFGELDRGRSMCVTRRCRLCIIIEECCSYIMITINYVYKVWYV